MDDAFYDIHCHVLPGLDDGPTTVEESLKMLERARRDRIKIIAASPHVMDGVHNASLQAIREGIAHLRGLSPDGPALVEGGDIRICIDLVGKIERRELPLINGGNYFLLEMPSYGIPPLSELKNVLGTLNVKGFTPVITHPERNLILAERFSIMSELLKMGAMFQLTAGSLLKKFGADVHKAAIRMIKKRLAHVVATDAHDDGKRPAVLSDAFNLVARKFSPELARKLFSENPLKIIRNEKIDHFNP
jgi:protein-tyrosine phosphatase